MIALGGVFVFTGLTAFFLFVSKEREPHYDGRSLSEWVQISIVADYGTKPAFEAREAIEAIGTNALPFLLDRIEYEPTWTHSTLFLWAYRIPFLGDWLFEKAETSVRNADEALGLFDALGPIASPAIPRLTKIMAEARFYRVRDRASYCLIGIGEPAVPAIVNILELKKHPARSQLVFRFGQVDYGSTSFAELVPSVINCTVDLNGSVASDAMRALGNFRSRPDLSLPVLIKGLDSTNVLACEAAGQSLSQYGESASNAIPALRFLLTHQSPELRQMATNALEKIEAHKPLSVIPE